VRAAARQPPLAVSAHGNALASAETGELAFVDNAVDPATNTVKLRARFANVDQQLWPGQFVDITLTIGSDADATVVPDGAVKTGPNGSYVFVVGSDGRAEQRDVQVARSVRGEAVIAAGVKPGDEVVTDGQSRLADGARVKVADAAAAGESDAEQDHNTNHEDTKDTKNHEGKQ